jgi:hypothetical protein
MRDAGKPGWGPPPGVPRVHTGTLVQRFRAKAGGDTIAFFIVKFEKVAATAVEDALAPVPQLLDAGPVARWLGQAGCVLSGCMMTPT